MLPEKQRQTFEAFMASASDNGILDEKTTHMIKLASVLVMGCYP